MSLWHLPLLQFSADTASDAPTPGGGSVACVAAVLGCDLIAMALAITSKRQRCDTAPTVEACTATLRALADVKEHLVACADADVAVFSGFMKAMAMPRQTDEERAARKHALSEASIEASEVPLLAATYMIRALEMGATAKGLAKPSVLSDVLAGCDVLAGAVQAALRNVDINLPGIDDPAERARLEKMRDELLSQRASFYAAVLGQTPLERPVS